MSSLQEKINQIFVARFGPTPLKERLNDIQREHQELQQFPWRDMASLKEETGDLLTSLIQLCTECDWDYKALIQNTLDKIERRKLQYGRLGRKYNVVIYGGAFNPIHKGHIAVAQALLNYCNLFDEVWLMPCNDHMDRKELAPAEHRLEMCRIAAAKDRRIQVFDYEIINNFAGDSYNLLNRLIHDPNYYDLYTFYFAMGVDNANKMHTWSHYEEIQHMITCVVFDRPGYLTSPEGWFRRYPHIYLSLENEGILVNISSTAIREKFRDVDYDDLGQVIDPDVFKYMIEHKLYR